MCMVAHGFVHRGAPRGCIVAHRVGAWWRTSRNAQEIARCMVAHRMGAWWRTAWVHGGAPHGCIVAHRVGAPCGCIVAHRVGASCNFGGRWETIGTSINTNIAKNITITIIITITRNLTITLFNNIAILMLGLSGVIWGWRGLIMTINGIDCDNQGH